jgi:hypothetical protein
MGYDELSVQLKAYVREALSARFRADLHVNKVRPQAYADGYMRALSDAGLFSQAELLELVGDVRHELSQEQAAREGEEPTRIAAAG